LRFDPVSIFSLPGKETVIKKILVVDDELVFLRSFSEGLAGSDGNLHVLTAEDGEKALKVLESEPVDLVVTDLRMPVMDGYQLIACLKRRYPRISVIAMSASIDPETERRLGSLGILHWIEKSMRVEDLVNKISQEKGVRPKNEPMSEAGSADGPLRPAEA
jgi:CheY-like chemotaxis protein